MTDHLHTFTALITVAIGGGLFLISRRLSPPESPQVPDVQRLAKNHLTELACAWLLLALYYVIRAILPLASYPADIRKSPYDPSFPFYSFVFHIFVMVFCAGTNIYLRRAVLELECAYRTADSDWLSLGNSFGRMLFVRTVAFLTDPGILGSFIASVSLLLFPMLVVPGGYSSFYVVAAYSIQLVVSSVLFFRLAASYWRFKGGSLVGLLALLYGLLQLMYPLLQLVAASPAYEFILTVLKILMAVAAGAFSITLYKAAKAAQQAHDLLKNPSSFGEPVDLSPLQRLGARLEEKTKLYVMFQISVALLIYATLLGAVNFLYTSSVDFATASQWDAMAITGLRAFWLLPAALIFQSLAYLTFFRFSYAVNWPAHSKSTLKDLLRVESRAFFQKWRNVTFHPAGSDDGNREKPQVILIHGIFSKGERCWGLLPAILLESGLVSKVHLVSYSHSLWSTRKRFFQVADELVSVLKELMHNENDRSVIFAHSLGGLLSMHAIAELAGSHTDVSARIKHLVCVASPLTGSKYAAFGWPWSWPIQLTRGSEFVSDTVDRFVNLFAPPGYITGEETALCSCSFFYGTRDAVAGSDIKRLGLPGERVQVPAWHSICAVYHSDSPQAKSYLKELNPTSRSVHLMQILLANLLGKRSPRLAVIFERKDPVNLMAANVTWRIADECWDKHIFASFKRSPTADPLFATLRANFEDLAEDEQWTLCWGEIIARFEIAFPRREMISMPWPDGTTLYLGANNKAGFALLVSDEHVTAGTRPIGPPEEE